MKQLRTRGFDWEQLHCGNWYKHSSFLGRLDGLLSRITAAIFHNGTTLALLGRALSAESFPKRGQITSSEAVCRCRTARPQGGLTAIGPLWQKTRNGLGAIK
jgi:hypothetical protein